MSMVWPTLGSRMAKEQNRRMQAVVQDVVQDALKTHFHGG